MVTTTATKTAKKSAPKIDINQLNQALGKFTVQDHNQSRYKQAYHGLRQSWGAKAKAALGKRNEAFDWKEFNAKFAEVMGDPNAEPSERKFSLEQLEECAMEMTGHNIDELIQINQRSWQGRKEYLKRQNAEANSGIDAEF
jgi:hypothetical protein